MSTPSPLQPPSALDGASSTKSRMRVTVLTILALHVVFIGGLLMQGCDKKSGSSASPNPSTASSLPSLGDTNLFASPIADAQPSGSTASGSPTSFGAGSASGGLGSGIPPADTGTASGAGSGSGLAGTGAGLGSTAGGDPGHGAVRSSVAGGTLPVATSPTEPPPGAPGATEHVIKSGDRIGDLAKTYGVTAKAIIDANPTAKPRNLKVGDRLMIPPPTPAAPATGATASTGASGSAAGTPAANPADGEVYVVKQGDNLSKIAKKFGVSVKALRAANQLKNDRLVPKQRLSIPAKTAATA
ncbi:MAG: LysM peptidoglycan-binding domain-containing protein, partial [Verrucomicrobiales bacterium]|nr:LysM peptidoglycan-binding domain-containing protein [Verrucomicrobiales bacterium]